MRDKIITRVCVLVKLSFFFGGGGEGGGGGGGVEATCSTQLVCVWKGRGEVK